MIASASSSGAVYLKKPVIIALILAGLGIILLVGLLSGLVARPNNCIEKTGTTETTDVTDPRQTRTIPSLTTRAPITGITTIPPDEFRLAKNVSPVKYELLLKTYFNPYDTRKNKELVVVQETYYGEVNIIFDLTKATNKIELHMDVTVTLTDSNIKLTNLQNNQLVQVASHGYNKYQKYDITTANTLAVGKYSLFMKFKGETSIEGFFKANYLENYTDRSLLATRFIPNRARTAFPCFDEPGFKAIFDITIEHPDRSIALSNFPSISTNNFVESGFSRKRTKFSETFKMSTYLVAFAVLPDDYGKKSDNSNGVEVSIRARKSEINENMADFALETANKALNFFIDYFGTREAIPPKIDLLALPEFPGSLSSSWGLNGFHEDKILYSSIENSIRDKQKIALDVAASIATYWVTNYVTNDWWNDIWLNEGMVTFFGYKAIQTIYPEYGISDQFLSEQLVKIMWDDGFVTTRPLSSNVQYPTDVAKVFDPLTYVKGAAILRMVESILGEDNFRNGIRDYINSKPFGTVTSNDFYNAIKFPSNLGVSSKNYMERWVLQKNYPEVAVLLEQNNNGISRVRFVQDRFLLTEIDEIDGLDDSSPFNYVWYIHLQCKAGGVYYQNDNSNIHHTEGDIYEFEYLLTQKNGFIDLNRGFTWVKCNKDFNGYYVTDYFDANFETFEYLLMRNQDDKYFSVADRINLIHVAFELSYLGTKSYKIPSLLVLYLGYQEKRYAPWETFFHHINRIAVITEHRPSFSGLRDFTVELVEELSETLNLWDDYGSHEERLLKMILIDFLCRMQDEYCLKKATQLFYTIPQNYFLEPDKPEYKNPLPGDLRFLVYKYHIQNTNNFLEWLRLLDFYEVTNDEREKQYALEALAQTRNAWLFDRYLKELFADGSIIRREDVFKIIKFIGKNPSGRYFAWYFIREYYFYIQQEFGVTGQLSDTIYNICESFDNLFLLEEVIALFQTTIDNEFQQKRIQTELTILNNIYWVFDREPDLKNFFFGIGKKI